MTHPCHSRSNMDVVTVKLVISCKVIEKFMQTLCTNRAQFMLPHFVINTAYDSDSSDGFPHYYQT